MSIDCLEMPYRVFIVFSLSEREKKHT